MRHFKRLIFIPIRVLAVLIVALCIPSISFSQTVNFPQTGFQSFEDLYFSLQRLPVDQFKIRAERTNLSYMEWWYQDLLKLDPKYFSEWNIKMKTFPTVGLGPVTDHWELKTPAPSEGRFAYAQPYRTLDELLASYNDGDSDIYSKSSWRK